MPTTSTRRKALTKWALIFACWTFLAFLFSGPQMIQAIRVHRTSAGWDSVIGELLFSYLWFALTPLVIWLSSKREAPRGKPVASSIEDEGRWKWFQRPSTCAKP